MSIISNLILLSSTLFLIYMIFGDQIKKKYKSYMKSPEIIRYEDDSDNFDDSDNSNDSINSDLYIDTNISSLTSISNNYSNLFNTIDMNEINRIKSDEIIQIGDYIKGYKDLIEMIKDDKFISKYKKSLIQSLRSKKQFYTNISNSVEEIVPDNINDIQANLSCNNDLIENCKEIISIVDELLQMIDRDELQLEKRFKRVIRNLNKITGRDEFKDIVARDIIVFGESQGVFSNNFNNMIIKGPAGCGKSFCVDIVDKVYNMLFITLRPAKTITKEDLANAYRDESSRQTRRTMINCLERLTFFDEAYIIVNNNNSILGGSNSNEVITTIVDFLADYKGKLNMIIAGYVEPMESFLKANDGLSRRFPENRRVEFKPYTNRQLTEIFMRNIKTCDSKITFCRETIPVLHYYISQVSSLLNNGAGDIINICRNFVDFCYTNKLGKWGNNKDVNIKLLEIFFNSDSLK